MTNDTFACLDDYSATAAQMRTNTEPYPAGVESLATTGAGELERLRFVLKHLTSWTYWYSHAEDVNFAHRMVRQHQTLVTDYRPMYRGEQTWSNAAVRFHGLAFSVVDGASHPESSLVNIHVGGTTALALSKRGDLHLGGSMAVTAGSVQHPSYTFVQDHQTGLFSAGQNTVAVGIGRNEVARFHGYGMLLAPHAAVSFTSAAGAAAGHISALSLAAGGVVQVGDATRPLLLRSADITAAADRVFGYTAAGTALEAKAIVTGNNLTITHAAGTMRFDVLPTLAWVGGNATEGTAVNVEASLATVSSLSIATNIPFLVVVGVGKSSGAAANASIGLRVNATDMFAARAVFDSTNEEQTGTVAFLVTPRLSGVTIGYTGGLQMFGTQGPTTGTGGVYGGTARPNATVTSLIIRGVSGNVNTTVGVMSVNVYTLTIAAN